MTRKCLIYIITVLLLTVSFPPALMAEDPTPTAEVKNAAVESKREEIEKLQKKVNELGDQRRTLSAQIQYMDTQIKLTELRIVNTQTKVKTIQKEIGILGTRIDGLDTSLNKVSKVLIESVVAGYKESPISFFDMLLDSSNVSDFLDRYKYFKITQENNQKILVHVQEAKMNFEEQKSLREKKKIELDTLEQQLKSQEEELVRQRADKEGLLKDTQNDEKKYQQLLQQALAEYNAIQKAVLTGSKVGPVKKGDPIALVGNSGAPYCSTGPHLHFEVRIGNSWVNAENYLSSKSVENHQDGSSIGSGSWDWPIQDPIVVEQRYGKTPWSWRYGYSGGIHTGIDMWSKNGDVIRAPADGTLYTSSQACGSATINIKYIDHGGGVTSFYLHVQ